MNLRNLIILVILMPALGFLAVGQAHAASGNSSSANPASSPPAAIAEGHSVKLTWRASVPASKSPSDMVVGYNVYRSRKSHDPRPIRINSKLCTGITYVDSAVEAGIDYFYVTRGVNAKGVESASSNETHVMIPLP